MKQIFSAYHIWSLPAVALMYLVFVNTGIISVDSLNYNLLMTAAVAIEGFLFTALSIILATTDRKFMKYLREFGSLSKLEIMISLGMITSGIALILCLIQNVLSNKTDWLPHIIALGVLLGATSFCISCFKLFSLLRLSTDYEKDEFK